jgi:hypothetical protein
MAKLIVAFLNFAKTPNIYIMDNVFLENSFFFVWLSLREER